MNRVWWGRSRAISSGWGSLTLTIMLASANTASASGRIVAPWAVYCSSVIAEPSPAPCWMNTSWPASTSSRTPDGCEGDAVLVGLDLGGDADLHATSSRPRRASQNSIRSRAEPRLRPVSSSTRLILYLRVWRWQ